eukprot:CAMPEP_0194396096 /NCGR_PEP_ID=MMETSP0174-20130528/124794_1 /TAXON_ID=216777 /ORGANISM="Proboscia alata, Strain PI-D3" /LENGTH=469 /DNA_ID=CAMNT_0039192115 /DNA_START=256 /DNA_END=1662 /DNA_ORIENTATION=+
MSVRVVQVSPHGNTVIVRIENDHWLVGRKRFENGRGTAAARATRRQRMVTILHQPTNPNHHALNHALVIVQSGPATDGTERDRDDSTPNKISKSRRRPRPEWASSIPWIPTWFLTLRPMYQLVCTAILYVFHLVVLTQHSFVFPIQLFPNPYGRFQSIGYDSLAGMACLAGWFWLHKRSSTSKDSPAVPNPLSEPSAYEVPWKLKIPYAISVETTPNNKNSTGARADQEFQKTYEKGLGTACWLFWAYKGTGEMAKLSEKWLYILAGCGVPMSIAMHRSLVVLIGHWCWVGSGALIMRRLLRPHFFPRKRNVEENTDMDLYASQENSGSNDHTPNDQTKTTPWYTQQWDTYWLPWVIGGYFVSSWFFNISDLLNQLILPQFIFDNAGEGVVSQLINPERNDIWASIIGFIAPCLSAPIWEELLYRGYMLPLLHMKMPLWESVFWSGLIFSVHHMSATGFIPLFVLGCTW